MTPPTQPPDVAWRRCSVVCLFIFISASRAAPAQVSNFTTINYGTDYRLAPWDVPLIDFETLLNNSSQTNSIPFSGPNVSAPYPVSPLSPGEGWSWQASILSDIAINSTLTEYVETSPAGKFFTGTRVVLKAPTSLLTSSANSTVRNATVDESWDVCLLQWYPTDSYPSQLRNDNGSCLSGLSSQCIADYEAEAARKFDGGLWCPCPVFSEIPSCPKWGLGGANFSTCRARRFNASEVRQWSNGQLEVMRYGGAPSGKGDVQAYNQSASLAWPVVMVWSQTSDTMPNGLVDIQKGAKMACVRAETAPAGVYSNGARKRQAKNWASLIAALLAAAVTA